MLILTDTLRDLLYSLLPWSNSSPVSLSSQAQSPYPGQLLTFLPINLEKGWVHRIWMEVFQFNGILAMSFVGNISPSGTNTSRIAEHKLLKKGSKTCDSEISRVMVPFSFHPCSCTWDSWLAEKQCHIQDTDEEHIKSSERPCPGPARYCHFAGTGACLQKAILPFYQANCFRILKNIVIPVSSVSMGLLLQFLGCETNFFTWSTVVCRILWQWIKYSVSAWVSLEAFHSGVAQNTKHHPFDDGHSPV